MKKFFLLFTKFILVLACAMFGALSLIFVEDLNVGGAIAFASVGAGTIIWDIRF